MSYLLPLISSYIFGFKGIIVLQAYNHFMQICKHSFQDDIIKKEVSAFLFYVFPKFSPSQGNLGHLSEPHI